MFFDNRDFLDFTERCALAGVHIPISRASCDYLHRRLKRMAELAGGVAFLRNYYVLYSLAKKIRAGQARWHSIRHWNNAMVLWLIM